jgi:predicted transcriptional regulator
MSPAEGEFVYRPSKDGVGKVLGELGGQVMEIIWSKGAATVKEVHELLADAGSELAYTTIKTVMTRIYEKGVLEREPEGRGFRYRPLQSREQFIAARSRDVVSKVLADMSGPILSAFVDDLSADEADQLEELARLIEKRRKES